MKTIAFIPVRGGSKSIPLKNIKPLCGKPLVCWNIEALERCQYIDEIVIATDSYEIWDTINIRNYKKTTLFHRSAENASDTASTESVMLEYIHTKNISEDNIFILVQATSPLTQTIHFKEAIEKFRHGNYDSILTCVRNKRFFWTEDGNSINYDYNNRPRRQSFVGTFMENGAFYINKVHNIIKYKNRLSGRIGIYEMPEYTAVEIDEPDDWVIIENIMAKQIHVLDGKENKIKLFITDIDGTLTDGGMYYSENGDELKKFNARDGLGLSLLHDNGIKVGIITGEHMDLNMRRAHKLNIDYTFQGINGYKKLDIAKKICKELCITLKEVAYIGDDLNDYELLTSVGLAACPFDANKKIKAIPGIKIMSKKGGDACVREFIDSYII